MIKRIRTTLSLLVCFVMLLSQFSFALEGVEVATGESADNESVAVQTPDEETDAAQNTEALPVDENTNPADETAAEELKPEAAAKDDAAPPNEAESEAAPEEETQKEEAPKKEDKETDTNINMPAFNGEAVIDGVKIAVKATEGVFPEGAALLVRKVSKDEQKKIDKAVDEAREDNLKVAAAYTFDVKVVNKDGKEIQPSDKSKVEVSFKLEEAANSNLDSAIYHLEDTGSTLKAEELKSETDKDVIIAETDGFSYYTVEFTYNDLQYVMQGGTTVDLSEIIKKVGLEGEVTAVEVSNDKLFKAEKKDDTWKVISLQPFTSEEWMKVTIDGIVYEIMVTDEGEQDWLHYSIDLIWDIADDDQKINQTVDSTSSTDILQPKYKFTIQTSTVDYAPEAMEFTLPLALFTKRTDLKDNEGNVLVPDEPAFYPTAISISDNPDSSHANSFYYTMDKDNNKLIIKNRETVYAGTNATIQVSYNLDPDSIYDMSIGRIQAKGNCTPTSETPGVVLQPEEATSREITYQLDTGFSTLEIENNSCKFVPYTIKDGYRYYYVRFYSHPRGNQEYDQEFTFDFLETDGEVVGPIENIESGTTMTPEEASEYYKGHSYGRLQNSGAAQTYHHNSPSDMISLEFYVRYPDSDEVKEDKLKVSTRVVGSDNDGYNHEDPDHNDIVSGNKTFSHTWVKYPDKPIGDYYKSPRGQSRSRIEIFAPGAIGTNQGAAYFVMGVDNNSVVGRKGNDNTLVITDTGLVPEDGAPVFDYEFCDVYIPLINAKPSVYKEDIQSLVPYESEDPWFDALKVEGSPDGSNWTLVYEGDGKDYNNAGREDKWYEKGYKQFRLTFSGIKEGIALTGEFARAELKSNEYTEAFVTRQELDQYKNWMHVDVFNSDDEKEFQTDDWAILTLTPFKDKGHSDIRKSIRTATSDPDTETVFVDFHVIENMTFDATTESAIYDRAYLQGLGRELQKLREKAPDYFDSLRVLDEYGDAKLYDLLPPGYHFEEVLDPNIINNTKYWINGSAPLSSIPTYEVIENYKGTGREMVIFTFPTGAAIEELDAVIVNIRASVHYRTSIKWEDLVYYQNERNFVAGISENGIPVFGGFPDDGAPERSNVNLPAFQDDLVTDDGSLAYYDVDGDGDTTTPNTLYTYVLVSPNVVMSSQSGIQKDIMGDSGTWCKLDHTDINETYKYRIRVSSSDSGKLSDLIIYDTLEEAANTNEWEGEVPWKGIFQSVDTSWLKRHGFAPVVYYSTADPADLDYNIITGRDNNPWINDSDLWSTELPDDLSSVTAVAVDCRKMANETDAVLTEAQGVEFEILMKAPPEYPTLKDPKMIYAYNRPAYSCKMYASFSAEPDNFTDIGHRVQIYLEPMIQVSAEKKWDDDNDRDRVRPSSITLHLMAGDEKIETKEVIPDEDGNWKVTFKPVPRLDEENDNAEIEYTIKEEKIEDYESEITGDAENGYTVTNTHIPEKTSVEITKTWEDDSNRDGYRLTAEEFLKKVHLFGNGDEIDLYDESLTVSVEDNGDNTYTVKVDGLYKNQDGEPIEYTITEDSVDKYESTVDGFEIVNTHENELTEVPVTKNWDDEDDAAQVRPESIKVRLLADGTDTGKELILSDENEWTGTFDNLLKYSDGKEIEYSVTEDAVEYYNDPLIEGSAEEGFTITNKLEFITEKETAGIKTWFDNNDELGIRPKSITINLYGNDELIKTVTTGAEDGWNYTFGNLPKYKNGEEIKYTIEEEPVSGYEATYEGFDISNECTQTKPLTEINSKFKKVWDDENDIDGIRPDEIVIRLLANGEEVGEPLTLSSENNWEGEFTKIPKLDEDGNEIEYSILEDVVEGYNLSTIKSEGDKTILINKHDVTRTSRKITTKKNKPTAKKEKIVTKGGAKTGDSASTFALVSLLAICAAAVTGIVIKRTKEQQ